MLSKFLGLHSLAPATMTNLNIGHWNDGRKRADQLPIPTPSLTSVTWMDGLSVPAHSQGSASVYKLTFG